MQLPERVEICEVGPRDGLQNEPLNVPSTNKVRLIECAKLARTLAGRPPEGHVLKAGPVNHGGNRTLCG